jgi:antitoxin ParD1/3/4
MKTAEKISITMTPEMMQVIRESVDTGEFASTSESPRDAVRVWQHQRAEHSERLNAIRARIRRSLDDPQPDISGAEVDERQEGLFASARKDAGRG